jgi:hypothetical protein
VKTEPNNLLDRERRGVAERKSVTSVKKRRNLPKGKSRNGALSSQKKRKRGERGSGGERVVEGPNGGRWPDLL